MFGFHVVMKFGEKVGLGYRETFGVAARRAVAVQPSENQTFTNGGGVGVSDARAPLRGAVVAARGVESMAVRCRRLGICIGFSYGIYT